MGRKMIETGVTSVLVFYLFFFLISFSIFLYFQLASYDETHISIFFYIEAHVVKISLNLKWCAGNLNGEKDDSNRCDFNICFLFVFFLFHFPFFCISSLP